MKYKITFVLIFNFFSLSILAQVKNSAMPLERFFKSNADSTIIIHYESNWGIKPTYFILSKKGDTINTYTYITHMKSDRRNVLPHNLAYRLYQNTLVEADINPYFNTKYLSADSLKAFWNEVSVLKAWYINDDQIDGVGCAVDKNDFKNQIFDASNIKLTLITKRGIKQLSFYAPQYYEKEVCPGRVGRQVIIKIENLFNAYFKQEW
ncbi:hypothetical protein DHW03_17560 [Pedobacter yonginense]|uniref:GLPGLI family protein n=1 Tax=Pedobacter yonginense TaxID=651869 RepID=A0A317EJ27_9SPHI|nr:hypothetical protein [Pedobacter yonginense]PWS26574.1 hypothetical protein DHW03_17560 [Pedobacter yonginense]